MTVFERQGKSDRRVNRRVNDKHDKVSAERESVVLGGEGVSQQNSSSSSSRANGGEQHSRRSAQPQSIQLPLASPRCRVVQGRRGQKLAHTRPRPPPITSASLIFSDPPAATRPTRYRHLDWRASALPDTDCCASGALLKPLQSATRS